MSVLFHVTAPPPIVPGTDAVMQDVEALRARFGGRVLHLYPFRRPGLPWPRALSGLPALPAIRRSERTATLHHVLAPDLYPYPLLHWLRRPVVYTVFASVRGQRPPNPAAFARIALVASSERDLALLRSWGFDRARLIRPGIDLAPFRPSSPPAGDRFVVLAGSSPWVQSQFRSKGVETLLGTCRALPQLRILFLWRRRLRAALERRIRAAGVGERVEIIDGWADVPAALTRVHAAAVLAEGPVEVKAYPHSLLEALAVGRPVLVSNVVPMADFVAATGCGEVVSGTDPLQVREALQRMIRHYPTYAARARTVDMADFSRGAQLDQYGDLYREIADFGPPDARPASAG